MNSIPVHAEAFGGRASSAQIEPAILRCATVRVIANGKFGEACVGPAAYVKGFDTNDTGFQEPCETFEVV